MSADDAKADARLVARGRALVLTVFSLGRDPYVAGVMGGFALVYLAARATLTIPPSVRAFLRTQAEQQS